MIWSPWLIWQAGEGWPQLDVARDIAGGGSASSEPRWALLPFQLLLVSPLLAPAWIAGLWRLSVDPELRELRFFAWPWAVLVVVFLVLAGKPYYLAGMFPVLLGAGAVSTDRWLSRGRATTRRAALASAFALSAAVSAVLALPVLPESELDPVVALNEDVAETVGWPELVANVAEVHAGAPDPARTAIVTVNYGEAGAIDRYGPGLGLPSAYSGHNGYWEWGPPPEGSEAVVAVGFGRLELEQSLDGCTVEARISNPADVDNEERGAPIWLCESTQRPWSELWPDFQRLG